jgi:purine-nucleoside/S-methyl-5'-thioadenosine phosphorylase / adenosine deaminase
MKESHATSSSVARHIPCYKPSKIIQDLHPFLHFRFPSLSAHAELVHGIFTRQGGVSREPYDSLNVSSSAGDSAGSVKENLERVRDTLGADFLQQVNQVHGDRIMVLEKERGMGFHAPLPADGIMTRFPGRGLMVKLADCQGVILYDPEKKAVAVVHCGWRGNVGNVLGKAVQAMVKAFNSSPAAILAAIGPSLGPCCGEFVGHETLFPESFRRFQVQENHFDLWAVSRWQLMEAGIREDHVEIAGVCTRCRTDLFFSYRKEGKTGRFAVAALLRTP